ncbi:MAG: crotonyl-CoA carboxylase/reductase [Rhodospirillales bacterium]|nr:crotonyl-CoA carboxylase/reductase [Rhodospirillales bacterium]
MTTLAVDIRQISPQTDARSSAGTIHDLAHSPHSTAADFAAAPLPGSMKAIVLLRKDETKLRSIPIEQRDLRKSLHHADVTVPEPDGGEVLVAVMAASLNFNGVWSALHEPMSPFHYLSQFARLEPGNAKHNLDYQIIGSDAAGIVVRVGAGVTNCRPGDRVVIHPGVVSGVSVTAYHDAVQDESCRAWGFETNFGALAEFCLVRANQIMPKPAHLTWEEAASLPLVNETVYRMLISQNGARMRLGESVLIWGATGGLGSLAIQYALRAGAWPIAVVSSPDKAALVRRLGCEAVIDRSAEGYVFIKADGQPNLRDLVRFRKKVQSLNGGRDPEIVFEHTGRETFAASVFVAAHGGRVVTCGSTTGYSHQYDNRYLWMHVKSIIGSHGATYHEAWKANDLVCKGLIHPVLSETYPLERAARGIERMRQNRHVGKIGVLCLADRAGLGVEDSAMRQRVGEDHLSLFQGGIPT